MPQTFSARPSKNLMFSTHAFPTLKKVLVLIWIFGIGFGAYPLYVLAQTATTIEYSETDSIFANPERGFSTYRSRAITDGYLQNLRGHNVTVVQRIYKVPEFRSEQLSEDFLNTVQQDFDIARQEGFKLIPRFSYTENQNGDDAALDTILLHLDQLEPLFRANYDVILYMEAGFIGAWGEWYYSSHNLNNTQDRRTVLFKELDVLPEERMVVVRTPNYKKNIYSNDEPLTSDEAYTGSNRARTGAHNDCFLASATDYGTYQDIQEDKNYLHNDNRFVPQGGETCNPSDYSGCNNALDDLEYLHWSVLNRDYHSTVLDGWEENGCMPEIKRRLGYRFQLLDASIVDSVRSDGKFTLDFAVWNRGFASPFNPRNVEVVLRHQSTGSEFYLSVDVDPRLWFSGDTTQVSISGGMIPEMPEGEYAAFLNLSDPVPRLRKRPEYKIRLANEGVWEDSTGYNNLNHTITLDQQASGNVYSGDTYFESTDNITSTVHEPPQPVAQQFTLSGNYPNPFNERTQFQFTLANPAPVGIQVYDIAGRQVDELRTKYYDTGKHIINWTLQELSRGIFFIQLTNGQHEETIRAVLK
ncbi:MAG: DUF4832 domain-containing protein [Candidatus Marinimicrobia bacterium]|nr:DUF4832 domain-containing protein [Candidatus Neomarinimicrobiota bacterium]MCF7880807.1 DUF4832 domain-containing protein [Candidatus Neomarinimicrobiota bacterium]